MQTTVTDLSGSRRESAAAESRITLDLSAGIPFTQCLADRQRKQRVPLVGRWQGDPADRPGAFRLTIVTRQIRTCRPTLITRECGCRADSQCPMPRRRPNPTSTCSAELPSRSHLRRTDSCDLREESRSGGIRSSKPKLRSKLRRVFPTNRFRFGPSRPIKGRNPLSMQEREPNPVEVLDDAMAEMLRRRTEAERLAVAHRLWEHARSMLQAKLCHEHPAMCG